MNKYSEYCSYIWQTGMEENVNDDFEEAMHLPIFFGICVVEPALEKVKDLM